MALAGAAGALKAMAAVGKLKSAAAGECVKVVVRCRPLSSKEVEDSRQRIVDMDLERGCVTVKNPKGGSEEPPKQFTFDKVYDWNTVQVNLYNETARPIVCSVMEGYNGTIFAYGQTGTGKSHTMEGRNEPPELRGIIPNSFVQVFDDIQRQSVDKDFLVRASYLEIYNEEVRDLLAKNSQAHLDLKESPEGGVYVKDLTNFVVKGVGEINNVLNVGKKNRTVGATLMNQDSSRSHSIFTITIETSDRNDSGTIRVGKLNLVDLAGSERQSKTGATGDRLKEATKINMSLSALGNVISSLVDGKSGHIPYRDSKLTRLLQDSLGGNTKTVMVANMGPADYNFDETISTLRYANRAKNIKNKPKVNEDPKDAMLREFQEEIARLKAQLAGEGPAEGGGGGAPKERRKSVVRKVERRKTITVEKVVEKEVSDEKKQEIKAQMQRKMERTVRASITGELLEKAAAEAAEAAEQKKKEIEEQVIKEAEEKEKMESEMKEADELAAEKAAELDKEAALKAELEAKLKALEGQVMHGSENLLEKSEEQEAMEAEQQRLLQEQMEQEAENQRRIAELEESSLMAEEKYNNIQDEVEMKTKKIKKLWGKFQEARAEVKDLQEEFSREREYLLDDIRKLTREIKLKNLVIDSFVPPEDLVKIHKRSIWDDADENWLIEKSQYAGNNVRMRHAAELLRQQSDGKPEYEGYDQTLMDSIYQDGNMVFNTSENLSNVFFSYTEGEEGAGPEGQPGASRPKSARRKSVDQSSRAGSARPKSSRRPGSAAKKAGKDDPNSIGSLADSVADLEVDENKKEAAFPAARGLVDTKRRSVMR
mmetsp:Transcript_18435/g.22116  ORF Transcript_18435/g.22116 Transcript_18435/m.22116 type:complete len:824 (+) Transcript_18435:108-2579(+)|eukprot:CAMPEP_0197849860 /NCGR_PEP_ID=MMETSP1438-20131217/13457_1 /TAXON_ID=1461541 /ORGANISM="Pterosperma sp., Strain CCMP1384" /LENGTH=823 /DNA_ID=CAMNT_0043462733 /DNA_START=105 /DNA_END=2576 /DNA_ORIENTATION=+